MATSAQTYGKPALCCACISAQAGSPLATSLSKSMFNISWYSVNEQVGVEEQVLTNYRVQE